MRGKAGKGHWPKRAVLTAVVCLLAFPLSMGAQVSIGNAQVSLASDKNSWKVAAESLRDTDSFVVLDDYNVKVESVQANNDELAVYVKATDALAEPIGFGSDGTVEIERFRFVGDLPQYVTDYSEIPTLECDNVDKQLCWLEYPLRHDPELAFRQQLEHTISLVGKDGGNIVDNKVGNTVTTVYSDADPETDTFDSELWYLNAAGVTWASARTANGTATDDDKSTVSGIQWKIDDESGKVQTLYRAKHGFNNPQIDAGDDIDSVIVSFYGTAGADPHNDDFEVALTNDGSHGSDTAATNSDFENVGNTEYASRIAYDSFSQSGYNDFTLNAAGLAAFNKNSENWYSVIEGKYDLDNTSPTLDGSVDWTYLRWYGADNGSNKPKMVITHSTPEEPVAEDETGSWTLSDPVTSLDAGVVLAYYFSYVIFLGVALLKL